jgi:hypothetical protein
VTAIASTVRPPESCYIAVAGEVSSLGLVEFGRCARVTFSRFLASPSRAIAPTFPR